MKAQGQQKDSRVGIPHVSCDVLEKELDVVYRTSKYSDRRACLPYVEISLVYCLLFLQPIKCSLHILYTMKADFR